MQSEADHHARNLETMLKAIKRETAEVLDRALFGQDIGSDEAVVLFGAEVREYNAMVMLSLIHISEPTRPY